MTRLERTLTTMRGAALMLNIVLGAGILALPGLVADAVGGYAFWSWVVCSIVAAPLLWIFIIMGRRHPHAGGVAHFTELAFGPPGFLAATLIFLGAVVFGLPAIALAGGHYLAEVLPGSPWLHAMCLLGLATLAHLFPVEAVGRLSTTIAAGIILVLLCLIGVGLHAMDWEGAGFGVPAVAARDAGLVFSPFMMIFFAFTGWEVAAGTSGEFRNPGRDFPKAMAASYLLAVSIYLAMAFVVQNTAAARAPEAVFASLAEAAFGGAGRATVSLLAAVIVLANLVGAIWAVSRLVLSFAGKLPAPAGAMVAGNGSPVPAVVLTSCVLFGVLFLDALDMLDIGGMLSLAGQNFLILYGIAGLALLRLAQGPQERVLSLLAAGLVAVLLVNRGTALAYPLCLIIGAYVITLRTRRWRSWP